ncbi:MAG: membrane protein insertase YidC [Gammaproteobacteria bacterium]|nr:MAG: membrane protein insertase YidC [Gammaproteobacteria bacterium]
MDNTRFILITSLVLILFLLYQEWQKDYSPLPQANTTQTTEISGGAIPTDRLQDIPQTPGTESSSQEPINLQQHMGLVSVKTDTLDLKIDLQGAIIVQAGLRKYPVSLEEKERPLVLLDRTTTLIHLIQDGLLGSAITPTHENLYTAPAADFSLDENEEILEIPFRWAAPDNSLVVTKVFRFTKNSHLVEISYEIENQGTSPWTGKYYGQIKRNDPGKTSRLGISTYTGAVFSSPENRYEKIGFDDLLEMKEEQQEQNAQQSAQWEQTTAGGWVAMLQHYFLTALIPANPDDVVNYYAKVLKDGNYAAGMISPALTIAPGQKGKFENRLYIGPKDQEVLNNIAEGLNLTVDYGWLWVLAKPLFIGLRFLHDLTGNWGWAIILVTVILKVAFFPLSAAGYRSMAKMRKVQPRILALNERYPNNSTQKQQAMMQIYKEEKLNPMGGCLPNLVQIPVFLALYWVLLESVEMRQAPFIFWLTDLSTKDPYYILPLIMGVTMFIQQKLNPPPVDPVQAKVMSFLPVIFTVFFAAFPSGLVLYWVANSVLSIAQQWQITRALERAGLGHTKKT